MPRSLPAIIIALSVAATACSSPKDAPAKDSSNPAPALPASPVAAPAAVNSNADRDFLRALGDHHKGLIALAHHTKDSEKKLSVKALAVRIDNELDGETDKVVTMLEQDFKDPYTPKVSTADQAMLADLTSRSGAAYDRAFLEHVVALCTETRTMIDAYLATATHPVAKALATTIRERLDREVPEFSALLAKAK